MKLSIAGVFAGMLICACQPQHPILDALEKDMEATSEVQSTVTEWRWQLPEGFPEPRVPEDNPMTTAKVGLGRYLFYDKNLSLDRSMSCASCHEQAKAFTDGRPLSPGLTGETTPRNSMSLANVGYASVLTWNNPHLKSLETQALIPMFGEEPPELGMAGQEAELLSRFESEPEYLARFKAAFPGAEPPVSVKHITQALASFQRTLISANSPYDRFVFGGDKSAISAAAKRGEKLFFSERLECFHCHGGFNFSDSSTHKRSAFLEFNFHNNGLYNTDGKGAYPASNTGIYELTQKPDDMGKFKAPTLRNIALTAPYMHDGSIATLKEVIAHYKAGGRTIHSGPNAGDGSKNPFKNGFVNGFELSDAEEADLLAFLRSLTDETFVNEPSLGDPFLVQSEVD